MDSGVDVGWLVESCTLFIGKTLSYLNKQVNDIVVPFPFRMLLSRLSSQRPLLIVFESPTAVDRFLIKTAELRGLTQRYEST